MPTKPSKKTEPRGRGREQKYNPADFYQSIEDWISEGKTLREWCRQPGHPCYWLVYEWMKNDNDFSKRFAQAREAGEDVIAEECLAIADDATNDYMERDGRMELDREHVQRSKLRIETRLKLLAKWNPKKYGDRLGLEHSGKVELDAAILEARKRVNK